MEVTPLMIYAIDISGTVKLISKIVLVSSLIASIILLLIRFVAEGKKIPCFRLVLSLFVISSSLVVFVPESKTLASMYVIPAVVNNEKIQDIGKKGIESLELLTKQWVDELREGKSKKDD